MARFVTGLALVGLLCSRVAGDCYLHHPRGSNNRLNSPGTNANNQNRLMDTQNNAKGGYNVGVGDPEGNAAPSDVDGAMHYYAGTTMHIEWTNQHACGNFDDKTNNGQNSRTEGSKVRECEIILQYACETDSANPDKDQFWSIDALRNGYNENTPPKDRDDRRTGRHEPRSWYNACEKRERNRGIFTADRRLNGNTAKYTRQNENGNRRGYECPEERDYYPYWIPTPWRDIAVLTNNVDRCPFIKRESQNVKSRGYCSNWEYSTRDDCEAIDTLSAEVRGLLAQRAKPVNIIAYQLTMHLQGHAKEDATRNAISRTVKKGGRAGLLALNALLSQKKFGVKGKWSYGSSWREVHGKLSGTTKPIKEWQPECKLNKWTRSNHLGNARQLNAKNKGGPYTYRYGWEIPKTITEMNGNAPTKCVFRIRYNMSSADYDNWNTYSWGNHNKKIISHNPKVYNPVKELQLTINTNQVSRTFQDRSHVFFVEDIDNPTKGSPITKNGQNYDINYPTFGKGKETIPSVTNVPNLGAKIHNLNVRGKRGNIVQAYPAVEYDFVPERLVIKKGDFVHFQWTGSDTNPKNYAGQGTAGTDRSNIMQIKSLQDNVPLPKDEVDMWGDQSNTGPEGKRAEAFYKYFALLDQSDPLLNKASAHINFPPVQFNTAKEYHFTCTRNNNFSNRSQKGTIVVENP